MQIITSDFLKHKLTFNNTLDIGSISLNSDNLGVIESFLKKENVHTLHLSYNQIGGAGAKELAEKLQGTQVHTLNLSGNHIGDVGAKDLAEKLKDTQVTKVLGLKSPELNEVLKENLVLKKNKMIALGQACQSLELPHDILTYITTFTGEGATSDTPDYDTGVEEGFDNGASENAKSAMALANRKEKEKYRGWRQTGDILSGNEAHLNDDTRVLRRAMRDRPHLFFNQPQIDKAPEPQSSAAPLMLTWH